MNWTQMFYFVWYTVCGIMCWWVLSNVDRIIKAKTTKILMKKDLTVQAIVEKNDLDEWLAEDLSALDHPMLMARFAGVCGCALVIALWPVTACLGLIWEAKMYYNYLTLKRAAAE